MNFSKSGGTLNEGRYVIKWFVKTIDNKIKINGKKMSELNWQPNIHYILSIIPSFFSIYLYFY